MAERMMLLVTSPRLPAGLLTAQAWDLVRAAPVYAAADSPQAAALRTAGVEVKVIGGEPATAADALLADPAPTVVWLAGPDGDAAVARHLRVGVDLRLLGSARCPAARRGRRDGQAALAGRLPVGRRADPRIARALPARRGVRGVRRDGPGRPGGVARGAGRRAAAGGVPRAARGGAARGGALVDRRGRR